MANSSIPLKTFESGVEIHQTLNSTNILAKQRIIQGANDGYIIVADSQTMGRGRRGRTWHSPGGVNIYLSMLVNVRHTVAGLVTLMGAVAAMDSIRQFCKDYDNVGIKWPNDVLLEGKKVAGVSGQLLADKPDWCVLGVGVNINAAKTDLPESPRWPATSLFMHLGKPVDRNKFLSSLVSNLRASKNILKSDHHSIIQRVRQNSATLGHMVAISSPDNNTVKGKAIDIDNNGFLVVQRDKNETTIVAGDITATQEYQDIKT